MSNPKPMFGLEIYRKNKGTGSKHFFKNFLHWFWVNAYGFVLMSFWIDSVGWSVVIGTPIRFVRIEPQIPVQFSRYIIGRIWRY